MVLGNRVQKRFGAVVNRGPASSSEGVGIDMNAIAAMTIPIKRVRRAGCLGRVEREGGVRSFPSPVESDIVDVVANAAVGFRVKLKAFVARQSPKHRPKGRVVLRLEEALELMKFEVEVNADADGGEPVVIEGC